MENYDLQPRHDTVKQRRYEVLYIAHTTRKNRKIRCLITFLTETRLIILAKDFTRSEIFRIEAIPISIYLPMRDSSRIRLINLSR